MKGRKEGRQDWMGKKMGEDDRVARRDEVRRDGRKEGNEGEGS